MNEASLHSATRIALPSFEMMDFIVANRRRIHAVQATLSGISQSVKKIIPRVANKPVPYGIQNAEPDSKELLLNVLLYALAVGKTSVFPVRNLAVSEIQNLSPNVRMAYNEMVHYAIRPVGMEALREPRKRISMRGLRISIKASDRFAGRIAQVNKMSIVERAVQRQRVNAQNLS